MNTSSIIAVITLGAIVFTAGFVMGQKSNDKPNDPPFDDGNEDDNHNLYDTSFENEKFRRS
jgi:hypothetical protein